MTESQNERTKMKNMSHVIKDINSALCVLKNGNKKCSTEIDKDFLLWKKDKIVKQCPKCKFWTEKNSGCNHITCAECKYQWCWLCRGKYSETHFEAGGTCAGLQFFLLCIAVYTKFYFLC